MVEKTLDTGDWLVIGLYFVVVIIVGLISSLKNRGSVGGYFLAGRSMHWIPVGASLFASNIGSGHFIGLAGSGAMSGIGIAVFELNAIFILMILGWFFVPVYLSSGVFTMPEYLKKRFGGQRIRIYLSWLALMLYVFTKISADLYSGAIFLTEAVPELNLYLAIIILLAVSALFTIGGGLTAVMWTDFIQTVIMIFGAFVLMFMGFIRVGGYMKLKSEFFKAFPDSTKATLNGSTLLHAQFMNCGIPPDNSWHLVRSYDDGSLPWPGVFIGLTISSIWYWCSDQVIVQRALAAKNLSHAKAGCILAGYLKFLPLYLIVFPGMIARVLFPNKIACAVPELCKEQCQQSTCSNYAYSTLVVAIMPEGLRGLMLAVMMSALISSLTSIFNSSSTIFTMDIWRRIHHNSKDTELMIVGRLCVVVLVAVGVFWIPVVQSMSELFHYIQAITSFLAPPICAVYCLAVFWKRTNETGAFWGLMVGLVVGMIRFIWEYYYPGVPCGVPSQKPDIIAKVHYLHFGILLFVIVIITTVIISLCTKPMDDEYVERLIFWNRFDKSRINFDLAEIPETNTAAIVEGQAAEVAPTEEPEVPHIQPVLERPEPKVSCMKKAIRWICGIEKMHDTLRASQIAEQRATMVKTMREAATSHLAAIQEDPFWERILNINAALLMFSAAAVWIFYR